MHAIGNYLMAKKPGAKVVYLHSETFVATMVTALQLNAINEFKRFYRSVDALLIDDIQFFRGQRAISRRILSYLQCAGRSKVGSRSY